MKVKCIKEFHDLERNVHVKINDEFEVEDTRGEALTSANNKAGCILCEVVHTPDKAPKAPSKGRKKKEA